jgi:hypothetical protein
LEGADRDVDEALDGHATADGVGADDLVGGPVVLPRDGLDVVRRTARERDRNDEGEEGLHG